jgi:hypothetical protein
LLADHLSPLERARKQGFDDLVVGFSYAAGSRSSGWTFCGGGQRRQGAALCAAPPFGTAPVVAKGAALKSDCRVI